MRTRTRRGVQSEEDAGWGSHRYTVQLITHRTNGETEERRHPGVPTHLLLLVEALLVTVWDVDTSGTQHIEELQMIQCVLHFSAAWTLRTVIVLRITLEKGPCREESVTCLSRTFCLGWQEGPGRH